MVKVKASVWTTKSDRDIKRKLARYADRQPEVKQALLEAADKQLEAFLNELEAWYAKHYDTGSSEYRAQIVVVRSPRVKYNRRGGAFSGSGASAWRQVTYYVSTEALRPLMVAAHHGDREAADILARWTYGH